MPKKVAASPFLARPIPFTGAAASAVNESPTVQSARRKLQYSQLPVRCPGKKTSAPQLFNSLKKFPVVGTPKHMSDKKGNEIQQGSTSGRKKSMSMIDLSAARKRASGNFEQTDMLPDNGPSSVRLNDAKSQAAEEALIIEGCNPMRWPSALRKDDVTQRNSQAAGVICRLLVINAWRHKRLEIVELRTAITGVTQQVDHLHLQIVVLRKLLDKENARVATLAGDLHRAKAHNDELSKERDQLRMEKEASETEIRKEHEIVEEQAVTVENLRNELRSARDQVDTLDKQIARDRNKLLSLRAEKKALMEKLTVNEALAEERNARASKAELSLEDTHMQLATQLAVTNSLQEEVQRCLKQIRENEEQKVTLEKMILKLEEENEKLNNDLRSNEESHKARAEYLASQLVDQEMKIRRLEDECQSQLIELKGLQELVVRQSQEYSWSSKVLQFAGSFIRAPSAILRTLSFFSSIYF